MPIPTVRKPMATSPIARCTHCGIPSYDLDALNFRCDTCGDGIVASVARQDWRRCPACFRSGRSPILPDTEDGVSCPVCFGTGWITEADYRLAEHELMVESIAVDNLLDAPQSLTDRNRYITRSFLGSVSHCPEAGGKEPRDLQRRVVAYAGALEKRMTPKASDDDNDADLGVEFIGEAIAARRPTSGEQ